MRITDKYILFWTGEFSNFWPCRIDYDSYRFRWSEQLFMYLKAKHYQDAEMCKQILNASSPPGKLRGWEERLGDLIQKIGISIKEILCMKLCLKSLHKILNSE